MDAPETSAYLLRATVHGVGGGAQALEPDRSSRHAMLFVFQQLAYYHCDIGTGATATTAPALIPRCHVQGTATPAAVVAE